MNKSLIILIIFCLTSVSAYSCSCTNLKIIESKEDVKSYDFIAQVKITSVDTASNNSIAYSFYKLSFDTLEIYRGQHIENILVSGSHKTFDRWTSCDLDLEIGDEWMIFGYQEKNTKKLITGYCTNSKKIKSFDGYEIIKYPNQRTLVEKLNSIFEKAPPPQNKIGKRDKFYANGNIQLKEMYNELGLNGLRKIWYPNGQLESNQYYKNGLKQGSFQWYSKNGQLIKIEKFSNDKNIDTTWVWKKIDTSTNRVKFFSRRNNITEEASKVILAKRRLDKMSIYNGVGKITKEEKYYFEGNVWQVKTYNQDSKQHTIKEFYKDGSPKYERIRDRGYNFIYYKKWDSDGNRLKVNGFDEYGNKINKQ